VAHDTGTTFRVWAPAARTLAVDIEDGNLAGRHPLARGDDGYFAASIEGVAPGTRYRYRVNGRDPLPDPASRYQPDGVHGASMVIDPRRYAWSDTAWRGMPLDELVIYELHVGTFTEDGTFDAAAERLARVRDLGVTAVEVMPVADFPGRRNWGYDGVALFAPARCYGSPDSFRRFVDRGHALGLAVLLDVVYNHLGPDGAYLTQFSPDYFTSRYTSPWGAAVNLDGPKSQHVRGFFIENALHWLHEYHLDGLRLDATHALHDQGETHFLAELSGRLHDAVDRHVHVIAEDDRNLAQMVTPVKNGGWGLDAVWADDFHHEMRRALAGDADGYYADYSGSTADIAATIRQGWFYTGQYSRCLRAPRGTRPAGIAPQRCIVCLQNHDQIGNRAFGDRLHHRISPAAYRAASALLLLLPETPLLFMGQEWAASSPFLYFTDHHAELGRLVTQGRRREFCSFAAFSNPELLQTIPDPQADATFDSSHVKWSEADTEPHASMVRLYAALLATRRGLAQ
jgi:maltooligosyltrehalose trehalohydrolase